MTIAELIEKLQEWPADTAVYVLSGADCDVPSDPTPEYCDWGNRSARDKGVFL
jgi:hypothetical protein